MIRNDATQRQISAADPTRSTWLSANAGSGKTRVLTDRVARLLLSRVQPQNILCLTYTKAAASEMQNRLFKRLGAWSMLDNDTLRNDLNELGYDATVTDDTLRKARRLFARAIETPGGLKIQTIHSFCSSLLRRFPLEARVSPQFTEMDDRSAELLRSDILDNMAAGDHRQVIDQLAAHFTGADISKFTADVVRHKLDLLSPVDDNALRKVFELPSGALENTVLDTAFGSISDDVIDTVCDVLVRHSKTMVTLADTLKSIHWAAPTISDFEILCSAFLYSDRAEAKIKSIPTKAVIKDLSEDTLAEFHNFMEDIAQAKSLNLAIRNYEKTKALYAFAEPFLQLYESRKSLNGWLDFDDLILKARALLTDPLVAQWVLFRLDGGIDHILVDEAQDTSPAQWDVIRRLAEEFTSGQGTRDNVERTIFVVGDKKQSIYSFQGADPASFDKMRMHFDEKLGDVGQTLQNLTLDYSFRSSNAVLSLVDKTFSGEQGQGVGENVHHLAFHDQMPGRVDLWPIQPQTTDGDAGLKWYEPLDRRGERHHDFILAEKIAGEIRELVDSGFLPDGAHKRKIKEGDFLILVQRRSPLFHEIIRACKKEGLAIAGADRLKIAGELAVKDISAVLEFLALPEDDLALANALKSPLFGWTEQELFTLAHHRTENHLWAALRSQSDTHPDTLRILYDLRNRSDFERPYDLIERLLTRHNGRDRLLARLGSEAQDGIDALLNQALAYERGSVPSLTGFLVWLQTDDIEIKRQIDSASNQIRVMTVHGSKGLEAPIVIMPDTAKPRSTISGDLLKAGSTVVWKSAKPETPNSIAELKEDQQHLQDEERNRLLYVAMTRAEKWLILCGAGDEKQLDAGWYGAIKTALDSLDTADIDFPTGTGQRYGTLDWGDLPTIDHTPSEIQTQPRPVFGDVKKPEPKQKILSPSDLGGAKSLAGEVDISDEDSALRKGRQIHLLLEHLPSYPEPQWETLASSLFSHGENLATSEDVSALVQEAGRIIKDPALQFLFSEHTLAEVTVTADLPELNGQRIHGIIDRLLIEDDTVTAVDFKSNQLTTQDPNKIPEGLLRQMGAYQSALTQIYPDHKIKTAILWTATAEILWLEHDTVRDALLRTTSS